ncbi:MAG: hypothetical protein AB8U25_05235 [Rickettsiales endosymbiont of Dermacentor nuttalli]
MIKAELGEQSFAAQYQQIKSEWIKCYKEVPIIDKVIQSWDRPLKRAVIIIQCVVHGSYIINI